MEENKFVILSTRTDREFLYTLVRYNDEFEVEVAHFAPKDINEINQNIINRGLTEIEKKRLALEIQALIPQIEVNKDIIF
jgi:hypothetical protein